MPWTDPSTHIWAAAEKLTAANMNTFIEANLMFLFGDTGWTNVASFTNSWTAGSPAPQYILIGRVVYLRGTLGAGTANTAAFTLPAGYRPSVAISFTVNTASPSAPNILSIATSGTVTPTNSAQTGISVCFPVV